MHPPQQDPFLSFSHTFLPKSVHVRGQRPPSPPMGRRPPQREILDPPLQFSKEKCLGCSSLCENLTISKGLYEEFTQDIVF